MACSICKRANVFNMSVEGVMMFSLLFRRDYQLQDGELAVVVCILFGMAVSGTRFLMPLSSRRRTGNASPPGGTMTARRAS